MKKENIHGLYLSAVQKASKNFDMSDFGLISAIGSYVDSLSRNAPVGDFDLLMLPSPSSKGVADFYLKSCAFLDEVDNYFGGLTSRVPVKHLQTKMNYLTSLDHSGEEILDVHTLFFTDKDSFYSMNPKKFIDCIQNNSFSVHGKLNKAIDNLPQEADFRKMESMKMIYLFNTFQQIGKVPDKLLLDETNVLVKYFSKIYGVTSPSIKKIADSKKVLSELIGAIDTESLDTLYTRGEY